MPIYEYRCEACGHELEAIQKISADPLVDCPACAQPSLKKKISVVGFRLKGSGWYETDFKAGDKKKNLAGDAPPADKTQAADKTQSADSSAAGKQTDSGKKDSKPTSKNPAPSTSGTSSTATG